MIAMAHDLRREPHTDRTDDARWNAVAQRDASRDGEFVYGVASTGIYCRPGLSIATSNAREHTLLRLAGRRRARRLSRVFALQAA